jgi:tetratricopeptide (TPR) repeat protein
MGEKMKRKIRLFAILILAVFVFGNRCWAGTAKLLGMLGSKQENATRISFFLDQIPEFEIKESGQRVSVVLIRTILDPSFKKMLPDEIIFHIETSENMEESVVDLYFRNVPKFVDVNVDKHNARLNLNILWDKKRSGGRPAILDQRLGEFRTSDDGSTAQKVMFSKFSGRWIDFFIEFEWPVKLYLPIKFSFPPFPSPLIKDNLEFLPQELIREEKISFCDQTEKRLNDFLVNTAQIQDTEFYQMIKAECFLRQNDSKKTLGVLEMTNEKIFNESLLGWKLYYKSYAQAIAGKYYQAANLLVAREEVFQNLKQIFPWYLILQVELELAKERPCDVLDKLNKETEMDGHLAWLWDLRKADTFYKLGQFDDAESLYQKVAIDFSLLQQHSYSLANWADVLYKKKKYSEAYRYYSQLSEILKNESSHQRTMVDYLAALSVMKAGNEELARLMLMENTKKDNKGEAGVRSRMKLIDLDLLSDSRPELNDVISQFDEVIKFGSLRNLREEAFFKQILACHLYGDNIRAVKLLGRFFEDYWAGELQQEAQALFVEIFPKVVEKLIAQDESFLALALVAKHRNLLAQAHITIDFLYNLARSYSQAGFFDQMEKTYFFILDFEKNTEDKEGVFLPLIQVLYQQKKYEQIRQYASQYLKSYPEGADTSKILYHYVDSLFKNGDIGSAVSLLIDKNRPKTKDLDTLAGDIFFELGKYDLVEYYFSRAQSGVVNENTHESILKRAEALFFTQKWQNAIPLYESLLDEPQFKEQAYYRLILMFNELGENKRAFKLYSRFAETEIESQWLKLAAEIIQIGNSKVMEN